MAKKYHFIIYAAVVIALLTVTGLGMNRYNRQNDTLQEKLASLEEQNQQLREQNERLQKKVKDLKNKLYAENDKTDEKEQQPAPGFPGGSGPVAYLTFDDGPSHNTLDILDILSRYKIQGTFFVTGNNVSGDPDIYKRINNAGHTLGNHTYTHNFESIYKSPDSFFADFTRLETYLYNDTGMRTNIMRFPGGSKSASAGKVSGYDIVAELIPEVLARGYDYFDWNVSSGDGTANLTAAEIKDNVLRGAERVNGDIVVLFHDSRSKKSSVRALPEIIEGLLVMGFTFEPLYPGAIEIKHKVTTDTSR